MVRKMRTEELSFVYRGPALEDGSLGLADFGNALVGYSAMVQQAVKEVAPGIAVPDVRFDRVERGSFVAYVTLAWDAPLLDSIIDFFSGPEAAAAVNAIEISGGVGAVVAGAVKGVKWIRGRGIASREPAGEGVERVTLSDGDVGELPTPAVNLVVNNFFLEGASKVIAPTMADGVDVVAFRSLDGEGEEVVEPKDRPYFRPRDDHEATTVVEEAALTVDRIAFDGGAWRFTRHFPESDGRPAESFSATVADEAFLARVAAGEVSFRAGVVLHAVMAETVPPAESRHRRSFVVEQVLKVEEQPRLFE